MRPLLDSDLAAAGQSYVVANTPLFLLRKLREDSAVHEIARDCSGDEILAELRKSMSQEPQKVFDYVRPYVYLTALSMKESDSYLKAAGRLSDAQNWSWDWFEYLRTVLLETYSPTSFQTLVASPRVVSTTDMTRTDAPVEIVQFAAD